MPWELRWREGPYRKCQGRKSAWSSHVQQARQRPVGGAGPVRLSGGMPGGPVAVPPLGDGGARVGVGRLTGGMQVLRDGFHRAGLEGDWNPVADGSRGRFLTFGLWRK